LNTTREFEWRGSIWTLTVGWEDAGRVGEIFLTGMKSGTDLQVHAEDDCFIISRLLQRGEPIGELAHSFSRRQDNSVPRDCDTGIRPISLIAAAIQAAALIEIEEGATMAAILEALAPASAHLASASIDG
jgi:hypothetical protein